MMFKKFFEMEDLMELKIEIERLHSFFPVMGIYEPSG